MCFFMKRLSFFIVVLGSAHTASAGLPDGERPPRRPLPSKPKENPAQLKLSGEVSFDPEEIGFLRIQGRPSQILRVEIFQGTRDKITVQEYRRNAQNISKYQDIPPTGLLWEENGGKLKIKLDKADSEKLIKIYLAKPIKIDISGYDVRVNLRNVPKSSTPSISISAATYQIEKNREKKAARPFVEGEGPYAVYVFDSGKIEEIYNTEMAKYVQEFVSFTKDLQDFTRLSMNPKHLERFSLARREVHKKNYAEISAFLNKRIKKLSSKYKASLDNNFHGPSSGMMEFNIATLPPLSYFCFNKDNPFYPIERAYERIVRRMFFYKSYHKTNKNLNENMKKQVREKMRKKLNELMGVKRKMDDELKSIMLEYAGKIAKMTCFDNGERAELRKKSAFFDPQNTAGI